MGFILLSGIIVNNVILLIHFAEEKINEGLSPKKAMLESIHIRSRPVLMTAFAVAAGMLPVALGSAIGMRMSLLVNGIAIIDDQPIPYFGATGGLSMKDNIVADQVIAGGTAEFYLRNTTVGALTTDYTILFTPM